MKDLEFVKELGFGYKLFKNEINIYIQTPSGDLKMVYKDNRPIYLNTKGKTKSIEEAEELVRKGEAAKYTGEQLYRMAFPDIDEFYKVFYGMSKKMKDWINSAYRNLGIVAIYTGSEERDEEANKLMEDAQLIGTFHNPFSHHDVEIYKIDDNKYALEYVINYVDSFDIRTIIFNRKPSINTFIDFLNIEEIEVLIKIYGYEEEFNCWECGRHTHFVDICAKSLSEKVENWKDNYCGCC